MQWSFHTYMAQPAWFIKAIIDELNERAKRAKTASRGK